MQSGFFIWQPPNSIERSWHPQFYAPEFLELEQSIERHSKQYKKLGDLVRIVPVQKYNWELHKNIKWAAIHSGIKEVNEHPEGDQYFAMKREIIIFPSEAIILRVKPAYHPGRDSIFYWNEDLYQGGGASARINTVLQPAGNEPIAWLIHELKSDYVKTQINRITLGRIYNSISNAELLNIKIKIPEQNEQEQLSKKIIESTRSEILFDIAAHRLSKEKEEIPSFFITGATFEERKIQFEKYLLELPSINQDAIFFVESSTPDKITDLFMVRPLGDKQVVRHLNVTPQEDGEVNKAWRDWYQDNSSGQKYRIFNSFASAYALPAYIMAKMIDYTGQQKSVKILTKGSVPIFLYGAILPSFHYYRDIVEPYIAQERIDRDTLDISLITSWIDIQKNAGKTKSDFFVKNNFNDLVNYINQFLKSSQPSIINWLESKGEGKIKTEIQRAFDSIHCIYSPVLAVKIFKEDKVAGVYLLSVQPASLSEQDTINTKLQSIGIRLSESLGQAKKVLDEAARSESLRRLSTVMHQINGPLGRIKQVIEDVEAFLESNGDISTSLVPSREVAENRSDMTDEPLEHFTLESRFSDLVSATDSIRNLVYKIRRLKTVHGELKFKDIDMKDLILATINEIKGQLPNLKTEELITAEEVKCHIDYEIIYFSIVEVLNNAVRELKENNIEHPVITIHLNKDNEVAILEIIDNALAIDNTIINRPFDEGKTKYRGGKGTGLGLTVVRDAFKRHNGSCELFENRDKHNERIPGVTFMAKIPLLLKSE